MVSEIPLKGPVTELKEKSDQLAVIPEAASKKTSKTMSEMFEETLTGQRQTCIN